LLVHGTSRKKRKYLCKCNSFPDGCQIKIGDTARDGVSCRGIKKNKGAFELIVPGCLPCTQEGCPG
jgi:hypothetical protein